MAIHDDLRIALRSVIRRPRGAVGVVLTMALGVGLTTTAYTVFDRVLFRSVPGVAASAFVTIEFRAPSGAGGDVSTATISTLREQLAGVGRLEFALSEAVPVTLVANEPPVLLDVEFVTDEYWRLLGARSTAGRLFDGVDQENARPVVVISEALWKARFGGGADVLDRAITINGLSFAIVGVVNDFRGIGATNLGTKDVWLPQSTEKQVVGYTTTSIDSAVGLLQPGTSASTFALKLRGAYAQLAPQLEGDAKTLVPVVHTGLVLPGTQPVRARLQTIFQAVMAGAVALLLLACANAANLLIARAAGRTREFAISQAIGASRWRLIRSSLAEAIVLAVLVGTFGLLISRLLISLVGGAKLLSAMPPLEGLPLDLRVFGFAFALAAIAVLSCGGVAAVLLTRLDANLTLRGRGAPADFPWRLRGVLVSVQVALCVGLLAVAGIFSKSLSSLLSTDVGVDAQRIVSFQVSPRTLRGYDRSRADRLVSLIESDLAAASIGRVARSSPEPLNGVGDVTRAVISGDQPKRGYLFAVSPSFFDVMGLRVLAGQPFTDADALAAERTPEPVVVNKTMAKSLFGDASPVGRDITIDLLASGKSASTMARVVAMVGDTKSAVSARAMQLPPLGRIYHLRSSRQMATTFLINSPTDDAVLRDQITKRLAGLEPLLPISGYGRISDKVRDGVSAERLIAQMGVLVSIMAAILAGLGIYAIAKLIVAERRSEFMVRMALGATPRRVTALVFRQMSVVVAGGLALGIVAFWAVSGLLRAYVFGVSLADAPTLLTAVTGTIVAAAVGILVPTRLLVRDARQLKLS